MPDTPACRLYTYKGCIPNPACLGVTPLEFNRFISKQTCLGLQPRLLSYSMYNFNVFVTVSQYIPADCWKKGLALPPYPQFLLETLRLRKHAKELAFFQLLKHIVSQLHIYVSFCYHFLSTAVSWNVFKAHNTPDIIKRVQNIKRFILGIVILMTAVAQRVHG